MINQISLSVCRDIRRTPLVNHMSSRDKNAERVRDLVINQGRFGRRCYFCDFAFGTSDCFEVHHLDGNHTNDAPDNMVPVCELCHAPFHLDLIGRKWANRPGAIIFLPELSQPELNNLLQAIFYSMAMQVAGGEQASAQPPIAHPHTVYRRLLDRRAQVEQDQHGAVIRSGLSDPINLSVVLLSSVLTDEQYAGRDQLLAGCRYLPDPEYFIARAAQWNAHGAAFSRLDLAAWQGVAGVSA